MLIGETPLGIESLNQWAICASIATAATVPLATSWLLSLPLVWRQLQKLDKISRQYTAFVAMVAVAVATTVALIFVDELPVVQGCLAVGLLVMTVPLSLLASNRLPAAIVTNRYFLSLGAIFAAFVCLFLGCIEFHTALLNGSNDHKAAEIAAGVLLVSLGVSAVLFACSPPSTGRRTGKSTWLAPKRKTCLPASGSASSSNFAHQTTGSWSRPPEPESSGDPYSSMLIDQPVEEEPLGNTESAWSWGVRSTVYLPGYSKGEFEHLLTLWPREKKVGLRRRLELETKRRLRKRMRAIKRHNPCA